jgi:hypothetical protein
MAFPKKKKKYRSPVEGPLRRLPGQSVRDERDKLLNDQLTEYLLAGIGFCFLAVWEWLRRWIALPFAAEIFTGAALFMTATALFEYFGCDAKSEILTKLKKANAGSANYSLSSDVSATSPLTIYLLTSQTSITCSSGRVAFLQLKRRRTAFLEMDALVSMNLECFGLATSLQ